MMDNFDDFSDNSSYDIHRLSSERARRFNRYRNRQQKEPENIVIEINFSLTNTFWGNSWSCNEKVTIIKGRGLKTSVNVHNSHSYPEVWDCRVIHFNSIDDHNIYLRSLDNSITIQIFNNKFTCTGVETHELSGYVSEKVLAI
jgi:hypothetical protein